MRLKTAPTDADAADRIRSGRPQKQPGPPTRTTRGVRVATDTSLGYPVYTLSPHATNVGQRVLYLHGGAYVADLTPAHWTFVTRLVERLGATVVLPRYPLAPEATWRSSIDGLLDLAQGDGTAAPVLMGDSAGGGLALALATTRGERELTAPALVLISPWVDLLLDQETHRLAACRDPWLEADSLRQCGRLWAGEDDPARAELSPLHADLDHLPPTLVLTGTRDVLHPQALDVVDAMRAAHTDVELETADGLLHVYPLLPIPEADVAFTRIATFLKTHLESRS